MTTNKQTEHLNVQIVDLIWKEAINLTNIEVGAKNRKGHNFYAQILRNGYIY